MIAETLSNDIQSLIIETFKGGTMKTKDGDWRGSVRHKFKQCLECHKGDKRIETHRNWYAEIYLGYLSRVSFKIQGWEAGRPFKNGIEPWVYLSQHQEEIKKETFVPWNYKGSLQSKSNFGYYFQKKNKYPDYTNHIKTLFPLDMKKIDRVIINQFCQNLSPKLKASSRNTIGQAVHSTLSDAYREGLIEFVPAFPRKEKTEKPAKNWLSWDEQKAVLDALPNRFKLLFLFIGCHGKRIGEGLSLKWEDIDLKKKLYRVYEAKVKTEQWLPLHEAFIKAFPVVGAIKKTGFIFDRMWITTLNRCLKRACKKAGVQVVSTHEFGRHSFAGQRLAAGFSFEQIAMVTNNLSSMQHYKHLDIETARKVVNLNLSN